MTERTGEPVLTAEERSAVEWTLNLHRTEVAMARECVNRWEHLLIDATLASTAAPSQPVPSGLDVEPGHNHTTGGFPTFPVCREACPIGCDALRAGEIAANTGKRPNLTVVDPFVEVAAMQAVQAARLATATVPAAEEEPRSVWIVARAAEPTPGVMGVYDNEDDAREDWAIRTGRGSRPDLERKYVVESWSVGGGIAPRESNR